MHFFWSYASTKESNDSASNGAVYTIVRILSSLTNQMILKMGVTSYNIDGGDDDDDIKELCIYKKVQNLYLYKCFNNNFHKCNPQKGTIIHAT